MRRPNWLKDLVEGIREGLEEAQEDRRTRQALQMPLDWPCTTCSGRGSMINEEACSRCDGSGYALSPRGRELVEFLTRHGFTQNLL